MDFDNFIALGWADHAKDPVGVAGRFYCSLALIEHEGQIASLTGLAHHVYGEHLGDWPAGLTLMWRIAALPCFAAAGMSGQAQRRVVASLALSQGETAALMGLNESDRIRVNAMAAANLASSDTARARALFAAAADEAAVSTLALSEPVYRALATTAQNLACSLEDKRARSDDERALMVEAAQAARWCWERAGSWLDIERAEYRLAISWLRAGDPSQGRLHAQACLAIIAVNGNPPLEQLFGWEALGLCAHAIGDASAYAAALEQAHLAFDAMSENDKASCMPNAS